MYNGLPGHASGKGRKTVNRAGARRLGQLSSLDVLPLVRHLRTLIILTLQELSRVEGTASYCGRWCGRKSGAGNPGAER